MARHPRLFLPEARYHVYCRVDEIADCERHPDATTFDGLNLAEVRAELKMNELVRRFESATGRSVSDLTCYEEESSWQRSQWGDTG